jgi:hypothetical protein
MHVRSGNSYRRHGHRPSWSHLSFRDNQRHSKARVRTDDERNKGWRGIWSRAWIPFDRAHYLLFYHSLNLQSMASLVNLLVVVKGTHPERNHGVGTS